MAAAFIWIDNPAGIDQAGSEAMALHCKVRVHGMGDDPPYILFDVLHIPGSSGAAGLNSDIKQAAVAAAQQAGFTVGLLDIKVILGGAV